MQALIADYTGDIKWNDYFYYDESSPTFLRHKIKRANVVKDGPAGHVRKHDGYVHVNLYKRGYCIHRVIWELFNEPLTENEVVDHIDGDKLNNSISNLRKTTELINQKNKRKYSNNSSGVTGVSYNPTGYWVAHWRENNSMRSKYFSIGKLGNEEAFKKACEYRSTKLNELKEQGDEYTDRHGL